MSDLIENPPFPVTVELRTSDPALIRAAEALVNNVELEIDPSADWTLIYTPGRIELAHRYSAAKPIYVDFVNGQMGYRKRRSIKRSELLPKALGVPPRSLAGEYPVFDTTAGLGRDSYVIATLGCPVVALERHPVMHVLLADGLRRAEAAGDEAAGRILLVRTEARSFLESLPEGKAWMPAMPKAIYMDPMFPPGKNSAAVKKEMAMARELIGKDDDAAKLLAAARELDGPRVVVKRHPQSDFLGGMEPSHQFKSKAVRFDVYLPL